MEIIKTTFLLVFLTVIFVFVGATVGGQSGMLIAFVFALGMNFFAYFYSDKMVLKRYNAIEVDYANASGLMEMVERLSQRANIPLPKVYIIPDSTPNAFATGRNPSHAAVAVTEGLLELLEPDEVEAVIAHELSHVKHYDILTGTIAATIAGAIAMLANIMQFGAMFGGREANRPNPLLMIAMSIILPIAASIIQMSISRSREYAADRQAALLTAHPEWLQSALRKLEEYARRGAQIHNANPETAHMFIINPFRSKSFDFKSLFSTHPSTQDRIERLEMVKREIR